MSSNTDKVSPLGYAILAVMWRDPLSGYDIRKVFSETPLRHYSSSPGSIYPALKRLEDKGLIKGETDRGHTLRPRKLYRTTPAGRKALKEWLLRKVSYEDVISNMEELLLRFAFMGDVLDDAGTVRFLDELIHQLQEYIPALKRYREEETAGMSRQGLLAIESGTERYTAQLRWARRARESIARDR